MGTPRLHRLARRDRPVDNPEGRSRTRTWRCPAPKNSRAPASRIRRAHRFDRAREAADS